MKALLLITLLLLFVTGCNGDKETLEALAEKFNVDESQLEGIENELETDLGDDISEELKEVISDRELDQLLVCKAELEGKSRCKVNALKGEGVVDFVVLPSSSPECFEKGAVKVNLGGKGVIVKNGCELSLGYKVAAIQNQAVAGDELVSVVTGFGMGDIVLPKRLRKGQVVDFNESDSVVELTNDKDGVGIKGGAHAGNQLNFDPVTGEFEALGFEIAEKTLKIKVTVSRMFAKENTGERGVILLLNENAEIVGKKHLRWGKKGVEKNLHTKTVTLPAKGAVRALVLPVDYKNSDVTGRTDSSDFYLKEVQFRSY